MMSESGSSTERAPFVSPLSLLPVFSFSISNAHISIHEAAGPSISTSTPISNANSRHHLLGSSSATLLPSAMAWLNLRLYTWRDVVFLTVLFLSSRVSHSICDYAETSTSKFHSRGVLFVLRYWLLASLEFKRWADERGGNNWRFHVAWRLQTDTTSHRICLGGLIMGVSAYWCLRSVPVLSLKRFWSGKMVLSR